ncbi:DUF4123 domain-containing protein [Halodesulfovibrio aestuarii]|uniref:DUF4123 domain-containing protein n=1 Tax=Halodesulfovibrio aestuarii TaxID=126333 RepID=UPI003D32A162
MTNEKLYAIIDGAVEDGLMPMLAELDPPAACLYAPPVQPDLVDIAPYVVLVDDDVKEWLDAREKPWGIYISTDADLKNIRSHLRKYLYVLLPDSEKPVFFRFYDPRNIWDFIAVLSDWELHSFMGPVTKIATNLDGEEKERDFTERRAQFPMDSISTVSMLAISQDQYEQIQNKKRTDYVNDLAEQMEDWHEYFQEEKANGEEELPKVYTLHYHEVEAQKATEQPEKSKPDFQIFAKDLVAYLAKNDIEDDRSIRSLAQLVIEKEFTALSEFPAHYSEQLERTDQPGHFKAEALLLSETGQIPS